LSPLKNVPNGDIQNPALRAALRAPRRGTLRSPDPLGGLRPPASYGAAPPALPPKRKGILQHIGQVSKFSRRENDGRAAPDGGIAPKYG